MAGNLLCSPSTLCHHIGLLFGERLDTLFTSSDKKYPDSPVYTLSDSLRIYFFPLWPRPHVTGFVADVFFSTLESGFIFFRIRCRIRRIRVDGSRIRKKKLRIQKYPDTCGRGLSDNSCASVLECNATPQTTAAREAKMNRTCQESAWRRDHST